MSEKELNEIRAFVRSRNIDAVAEKLLFELGFKCNLHGTLYLKKAIAMQYENGLLPLRNEIYPEIAEVCNSMGENVERSIRHAISICYGTHKPTEMTDLFGKSPITSKYPPSNGEFISVLCTWIRLEKAVVQENA